MRAGRNYNCHHNTALMAVSARVKTELCYARPTGKIKELDTFRVVTRTGQCDMVLFHSRWRLQADVWVWSDEMKIWRGCAAAFE